MIKKYLKNVGLCTALFTTDSDFSDCDKDKSNILDTIVSAHL